MESKKDVHIEFNGGVQIGQQIVGDNVRVDARNMQVGSGATPILPSPSNPAAQPESKRDVESQGRFAFLRLATLVTRGVSVLAVVNGMIALVLGANSATTLNVLGWKLATSNVGRALTFIGVLGIVITIRSLAGKAARKSKLGR